MLTRVRARARAGFNIVLREPARERDGARGEEKEQRRKRRNRNELAKRHSFNRVREYKWVLISPELEHRSREFGIECI